MLKILTVDDSRSVRAFVRECFSGKSFRMTEMGDGAEAIANLGQASDYDLILLDWEMPKMNGIQTLAAIKTLQIGVPVIMMTTRNAPSDISLAIEGGAKEYIMKPFTQDILFGKIESVIGRPIKDEKS